MATLRIHLACLAVLALSAGTASAQPLRIDISPRLPTTLDRIEVTVSGPVVCIFRPDSPQGDPRVEDGRVILPLAFSICNPPVPNPLFETYTFGPLPAGTWALEVLADNVSLGRRTVDVIPASHDLFLQDGEFRVRVEWSAPGSALRGEAYGVPLSDDAGYLWFFEGKNPEILVKILDGRPVNGHWWVFISSNTNLEFNVHVGQRNQSNPLFYQERVYVSPAGANKNFIDTESFRDN
ncbi:MAG TPA: hypothetical protein VLT87_18795 [Thermoanaerobaculia bacterium]|nr:hypothetical protein [Thermoanaerobaculia bacterium]